MRRFARNLLASVLVTIIFIVLFPGLARPELTVRRWWVTDAAAAAVDSNQRGSTPVVLSDSVAYLNATGAVGFRAPRGFGATADTWGFVNYGQQPRQLILQSITGAFIATVDRPGYPTLIEDRLVVTGPDDTTVTMVSSDGTLLWDATLEAPITVMDYSAGITAIGLISGGVAVFDEQGNRLSGSEGGATSSLTCLAVAIHDDSRSVAALLVGDETALVVFQTSEGTLVPTLRVPLADRAGAPVPALFTRDGRYVVFAHDGIRIVNSETGATTVVPALFSVDRFRLSGDELLAAVGSGLSPDPQRGFRIPREIVHFQADGVAPARQVFWSNRADLTSSDGQIWLSDEDRVLSYSVAPE